MLKDYEEIKGSLPLDFKETGKVSLLKKKKKFSNMKEKTTSPFPVCLQGDCVKFCI